MILAYQQFQKDANGWGALGFDEFKRVLWPLRAETDIAAWPDASVERIFLLKDEGAGRALQVFFGKNPAAARVLGGEELRTEPVPRAVLEKSLEELVRQCLAAGWGRARFSAYLEHLDSGRDDLGEDLFAATYRRAGPRYQQIVREALARGAPPL